MELKIIRSFPISNLTPLDAHVSGQYKIRTQNCKPCRFFFPRENIQVQNPQFEDFAFILDVLLNSSYTNTSLKKFYVYMMRYKKAHVCILIKIYRYF